MNPIHSTYADLKTHISPDATILNNDHKKQGWLRYVFTPSLTIAAMFREFYELPEQDQLSLETMSDIAVKHGQEFVEPHTKQAKQY